MVASNADRTRTERRPDSKERLPSKIDRCCPRCRHHAYHWLTHQDSPAALKTTRLHTATCVRCGHGWPCRVLERDR